LNLSSIRSPWNAGGQAGVRFGRLSLACLLAALVAALLAGPAHATLSAVGPVNPATGYPDWYQDGTGLKLQLCLDGLPSCSAAKADLTPPGGEAFWWRAQADVAIGGGTAKLALAQEAAFVNAADKISFGRVRVLLIGVRPDTMYTITHPYGTLSITTDGQGNGRSTTDIGCGAAPCDWTAALGTAIGPLVHWDPTVSPAPQAGYIGDAATPHKVVGSPNGFNAFRVAGGGATATTDQMIVEGKLAGPPVPVANVPATTDFGSSNVGVPVTKDIVVTSFGVPDAAGASNLAVGAVGVSGPNPAAFKVVGDTCTNRVLPSGAACVVNVQFTPGAAGPTSATLDIPHNAGGLGNKVVLSGEGIAPPAPAAAPGAAAGGQLAGAAARSRLAIAKLRTSHRMSRARVLRRGLRLSMRVPQGTEILKIAVHRVRRGRAEARNVWLGFRVVTRAGLIRVRLDTRALRRRLNTGLYQVNVTPGASRHELGRTTSTRVRITRR
jgi:hypothetical protein